MFLTYFRLKKYWFIDHKFIQIAKKMSEFVGLNECHILRSLGLKSVFSSQSAWTPFLSRKMEAVGLIVSEFLPTLKF